jgi:serine/threonine protein kinase
MHVQLTDFGSGVIVEDNEINGEKKPLQRTNSFVGTPQFVAPEILQRAPIHYGFVRFNLMNKIK